jgi:hypothetical protein
MITAVRKMKSGSSLCFVVLVDSGIKQLLKQTQLFHIPDDLAATPVFFYLVSWFDADNGAELNGFDELSLSDVFFKHKYCKEKMIFLKSHCFL